MTIRVRFAPSPTGYLHIGGARTALFNWMFARKHGGQFILRIEDTDQNRTVPGAVGAIMEGLRWLGLDWDEGPDVGGEYGPYTQTERAHLYREWSDWLLANGRAYKCFCTSAELAQMREQQRAAKQSIGYDRRCRYLTPEQIAEKEAAGLSHTIRFKMPLDGSTVFHDLIRGPILFENTQVTDNILLKSDGLPTYHLANVIDDHFMAISHILRADEWISTAPLHMNLYQAFGWEPPVFAHLPLVLNPSGKGKLSKRTQRFTDSGQEVLVKVDEFQEAGLLPETVVNFLANVGWSFGNDVEKFTLAEAMPRFELADINPAPSRLNYTKLDWLNGQYIQEMEPMALAQAVKPFLDAAGFEVNPEALLLVMPPMSKRLKRLPEAMAFLRFLFDDAPYAVTPEQLQHKHLPPEAAKAAFTHARDILATIEPFTVEKLGAALFKLGEGVTVNGKAGPFLGTMRLAMTGQKVSPPLFESLAAMGRERALARLDEVVRLFNETED